MKKTLEPLFFNKIGILEVYYNLFVICLHQVFLFFSGMIPMFVFYAKYKVWKVIPAQLVILLVKCLTSNIGIDWSPFKKGFLVLIIWP